MGSESEKSVSEGNQTGSITFRASLPGIKSAILLDGNGDGGQLKLEIPRSDTGALLLLQNDFAGKSFTVTIEAIDSALDGPFSLDDICDMDLTPQPA